MRKYIVWTLVIWLPIIPLAVLLLSLPSGGSVDSGEAPAFLVFGVGFPIYVVGLALMLLWDRPWSSRQP